MHQSLTLTSLGRLVRDQALQAGFAGVHSRNAAYKSAP